jgi:hypothetical protein
MHFCMKQILINLVAEQTIHKEAMCVSVLECSHAHSLLGRVCIPTNMTVLSIDQSGNHAKHDGDAYQTPYIYSTQMTSNYPTIY